MVHWLSAKERSPYLKRAVLCPSEAIMRLQKRKQGLFLQTFNSQQENHDKY